ncbi:MAG: threonylcarbamoyl-AMP synthase [Candidatus Marinimicrobia bacterium]|nr:threonylcarbamoyl-AMP synthase [Candidatus Neomarinimicrobiota bacterium]
MKPLIVKLRYLDVAGKAQIYDALQSGQIIAYPTDTIYGLGIDIFNPKGIDKLFSLKGRDSNKPVSILYSNVNRVLTDFQNLNEYQQRAVRSLMPGKVTLLLPAPSKKRFPDTFIQESYIGVRVVDLPALNNLIDGYPHPISTTSSNPTDLPPAKNVQEIIDYFGSELAVVIDNGKADSTRSSTVIKLYDDSWEILREGAVSQLQIEISLSKIMRP